MQKFYVKYKYYFSYKFAKNKNKILYLYFILILLKYIIKLTNILRNYLIINYNSFANTILLLLFI